MSVERVHTHFLGLIDFSVLYDQRSCHSYILTLILDYYLEFIFEHLQSGMSCAKKMIIGVQRRRKESDTKISWEYLPLDFFLQRINIEFELIIQIFDPLGFIPQVANPFSFFW